MEIAQKHKDQLNRIKKNIQKAYSYFEDNYKRWHSDKNFVFVSTLGEAEISVLKQLKKPELQFNILEPYISRLTGEFSKQEPSIEVSTEEDMTIDPQIVDIVEGHIRHIEYKSRHDGFSTEIFNDTTAGGFSVAKVYTDYESPKSFKQEIRLERKDPTLCGFDPLAKKKAKQDGRFCFEIFYKTKEEFEEEYPDISLDRISFSKSMEGFNWSYKHQTEDIVALVDYYEKKKKKVRLVKIATGEEMTKDEYVKMQEEWDQNSIMLQFPVIVAERTTELETIVRYRLIETQVIEYVDTDYIGLPLVFFDGNSTTTRKNNEGSSQQYTRSLIYNAKDIQRLKNHSGQALAYSLMSMSSAKLMAPIEAIPKNEDYVKNYQYPQFANILLYNQFYNNNPDVRLDPPQTVQQQAILPEVTNTFSMTDQMTQNIMGSYDAALGINGNNVSGRAIEIGAIQSNAASTPYIVNYIESYNRVAELILGLIPKYYTDKKSIPVIDQEGNENSIDVNKQGSPSLKFDHNKLKIKVEAGVNFSIQKNQAIQFILGWLQAAPMSEFSAFINAKGTPVILKNLDIHGTDQLKAGYEQWQQEKAQMAQQQQQQQQQMLQNDPNYIKAQSDRAKVMIDAKNDQVQNQLDAAKLALEKEALDTDRLKVLAEVQERERQHLVQTEKDETDNITRIVELAIKSAAIDQKNNQFEIES